VIPAAVARIRGDDLIAIGLEPGPLFGVALNALPQAVKRLGHDDALAELGVIPGSMATPGFVVRGRGLVASLESASHGAGRVMSRTAARRQFTWKQVQPLLDQAGVRLLSSGIAENPLVYKDINDVIAAQTDLVDVVARFSPRIVRMADSGEKPEDRDRDR
jgi:tRNA-splicing ligase RtcB